MMRKQIFYLWIPFIVLLSSCNLPQETNNDLANSEDRILTAAAATVETILTESPKIIATEPPVSTLTISTLTATGTIESVVELTDTSTESEGESELPCNLAGFIDDVTVDDGEDFKPNETFIKTWRLKNIGSCNWTPGYEIVFFDGYSMNGPASQQITNVDIAPGETVDISVELTAPIPTGNYEGFWKLRSDTGLVFTFTNNAAFWVIIDVVP